MRRWGFEISLAVGAVIVYRIHDVHRSIGLQERSEDQRQRKVLYHVCAQVQQAAFTVLITFDRITRYGRARHIVAPKQELYCHCPLTVDQVVGQVLSPCPKPPKPACDSRCALRDGICIRSNPADMVRCRCMSASQVKRPGDLRFRCERCIQVEGCGRTGSGGR